MKRSVLLGLLQISSTLVFAAGLPAKKVGRTVASTTSTAETSSENLKINSEDSVNIKKVKTNLAKTQKSIDLTKERIKSPKDVEFLPDLYFSLAELLLEKSRFMYSLKLESKPGTPADEIDFTAEKRVKQEAIEIYQNIKERFLQFGQRDRVLFVLGSELKDVNDTDNSLKVFKELVEKYPQSSYWEKAQLSVGNIFYDKKDFEFAKQQYVKILAREEKSVFAVAYYKIGQCEIYLDHFLEAMIDFEKAVDISKKYKSQLLTAENEQDNVKEEALIASVWPITELTPEQLSKNPKFLKPIDYYLGLSDDKAMYRRVMLRLARRFAVKNRDFEAAQVNYEILRAADDPEMRREALENYYFKMKSSKKDYFPDQLASVLRDTFRAFKLQKIDYRKYEPLYRDIATSINRIGQTSKRKIDLENAIAAYKDYLEYYPATKYHKDIQVNTAEALYNSGNLIEAGKEFSELATLKVTEKEKKDFISSALKALSENFAKSTENTVLERSQGRYLYRQAAAQFIKFYPKDPEVNQVAFNIAKTYYDEKDYKSAVPFLKKFLAQYPTSSHGQEAVLLLLDTYYTRDDLKGLVQEGRNVLNIAGLGADVRKKVQDIVQQSQLKDMRNLAGEFGSKDYSNKILQFAKSNKSSGLGETALFEAFVSLRSANDEKLFSVGEDFLGTFPNSLKGKEVLLSMTQTAVGIVDFNRASKYLLAYAQKYPQDAQSKNFTVQAAQISEQIGYTNESVMAYRQLGQLNKVASLLEKSGNWDELQKLAPQLKGARSLFYSGLAYLRTNKKTEAMGLFRRLVQQGNAAADEKEYVAHAGYILADQDINDYKESFKTTQFTPQNLTAKINQHQEIERSLQNVISYGVGPWTIGSLYLSGKINSELTLFLKNAKPPAGMDQAKLAAILAPQIKSYSDLAQASFKKCADVAESNDVFTDVVNACRTQNLAYQLPSTTKANRTVASINPEMITAQKALYKNPRDTKTLYSLVVRLTQGGNYQQAFATLSRLMEIDPANTAHLSESGVLYIYLNDMDLAIATFKESLKKDAKDATALWGLASIYKNFGFNQQSAKYLNLARAAGKPKGLTHPWMKL